MTLIALALAAALAGDPDTVKLTVEFEKTSLADILEHLTLVSQVPIELDESAKKKLGDPAKVLILPQDEGDQRDPPPWPNPMLGRSVRGEGRRPEEAAGHRVALGKNPPRGRGFLRLWLRAWLTSLLFATNTSATRASVISPFPVPQTATTLPSARGHHDAGPELEGVHQVGRLLDQLDSWHKLAAELCRASSPARRPRNFSSTHISL